MTFDPQDRTMARARGQVMYRYRPHQTFDHVGGYVAQVRVYGRDDAYQGPMIDKEYLVDEAMRLVRRWRVEGQLAAARSSDPTAPRSSPRMAGSPTSTTRWSSPGRCSARSGRV